MIKSDIAFRMSLSKVEIFLNFVNFTYIQVYLFVYQMFMMQPNLY